MLADLVADLGVEDLGTATREATEPSINHVFQHAANALICQPAKPVDLDGRPSLEVQLGIGFVQDADEIEIPVVFSLMMESADDMHLGTACGGGFGAAGEDLLVAHGVALGLAEVRAEGAEHAAINADVGRVEMRV